MDSITFLTCTRLARVRDIEVGRGLPSFFVVFFLAYIGR